MILMSEQGKRGSHFHLEECCLADVAGSPTPMRSHRPLVRTAVTRLDPETTAAHGQS